MRACTGGLLSEAASLRLFSPAAQLGESSTRCLGRKHLQAPQWENRLPPSSLPTLGQEGPFLIVRVQPQLTRKRLSAPDGGLRSCSSTDSPREFGQLTCVHVCVGTCCMCASVSLEEQYRFTHSFQRTDWLVNTNDYLLHERATLWGTVQPSAVLAKCRQPRPCCAGRSLGSHVANSIPYLKTQLGHFLSGCVNKTWKFENQQCKIISRIYPNTQMFGITCLRAWRFLQGALTLTFEVRWLWSMSRMTMSRGSPWPWFCPELTNNQCVLTGTRQRTAWKAGVLPRDPEETLHCLNSGVYVWKKHKLLSLPTDTSIFSD